MTEALAAACAEQEPAMLEWEGRDHWWRVQITPLGACSVLVAFADITAQKAHEHSLRASEQLNREILAGLQEGVVVVDMDACVVVANEAAAALFGVSWGSSRTALSAIPVDLLDDRGHLLGEDRLPLMRALEGEEVRGQVVRFVRRDGSLLWVEVHANPLYDGNGAQYGAVASYDDVTARVEQDRRTRHEADTDVLTGLANRRALERTLDAALARAGARSRSVGVVMLDLDGFKAINDTRGHAAGDAALREVAARLRRCVRERDLVARLGGDEFVIVLTDLGRRPARWPASSTACATGSPRRSPSRSSRPPSAWPCTRPRRPPPPTCSPTPIGRCTWTRARATARSGNLPGWTSRDPDVRHLRRPGLA